MANWNHPDDGAQRLPLYRYTRLTNNPLRPKEAQNLRLLHLKPGAESDPLSCTLDIVNAERAPKYEAVSWCWAYDSGNEPLRITEVHKDMTESVSVMFLPQSLARGLRTLRRAQRSRTLWVDFVCINQSSHEEKNTQVPMMNRIYGNARSVCIWLDETDIPEVNLPRLRKRYTGDDSDDSSSDEDLEETRLHNKKVKKVREELQNKMAEQDKKAIDFIRDDVLGLWKFDELCKNKAKAEDWAALLSLMRKPWFSRRWVVQEIALAKKATIYTGKSHLPWRDFVDAVSLFVEVEDATRRLTEIMQQHEVYNHVPDFFEDLSAIGASMLVTATSNLYRGKNGKRDSQKSLESLVSALAVFDVSNPKDAIYALLAIARDTSPLAANQEWNLKLFQRIVEKGLDKDLTRQTFRVDYSMKTVEVFKEFIAFAIRRSMSKDPTHALDILCRPWAPDPNPRPSLTRGHEGPVRTPSSTNTESFQLGEERLPSWIMGPEQAAFKMYHHPKVGRRMGRINADPLVGLPDENRPYRAAESKGVNGKVLQYKKCNTFYSLSVEGFELDRIGGIRPYSQNGHIPWDWIEAAGWMDTQEQSPPEDFWRTLVGDRGQYGRNAPAFFERACHESVKSERSGETIDTKKLITEGRCSIVAAFLRRVQAVIWNRRLARGARTQQLCMTPKATEKDDMICILYGCSVPVILRPHYKTDDEMEDEIRTDDAQWREKRDVAARRIATFFRKRQLAKLEQGLSRASTITNGSVNGAHVNDDGDTLRRSRRSTMDEDCAAIAQEEKDELSARLKAAKATPPKDPSRRYFEFIGPCYFHGFMNGEAIEEQNTQGIHSQVFEIH